VRLSSTESLRLRVRYGLRGGGRHGLMLDARRVRGSLSPCLRFLRHPLKPLRASVRCRPGGKHRTRGLRLVIGRGGWRGWSSPVARTSPQLKASAINYLVDAGPLIGLLDGDDQWHAWSAQTLSLLDEPLATTETAVAEACHRLRNLRPALQALTEMIAEGRVVLWPVLSEHARRVGELVAKYPRMDVGDATLVVLSELCPGARLITVDADFRRYRRFRNQAIPVVMPVLG